MTKIDNGQQNYDLEDELIDMLDQLPLIKRYEQMFADLCKGTIDVPAAIKQLSVPAMVELVNAMHNAKDLKLRAQIAQDFLDRAGHGKINKHAVASAGNVDLDDSKTELIHFIMSAASRNGIDVVKGEVVQNEKNVTPSKSSDKPK